MGQIWRQLDLFPHHEQPLPFCCRCLQRPRFQPPEIPAANCICAENYGRPQMWLAAPIPGDCSRRLCKYPWRNGRCNPCQGCFFLLQQSPVWGLLVETTMFTYAIYIKSCNNSSLPCKRATNPLLLICDELLFWVFSQSKVILLSFWVVLALHSPFWTLKQLKSPRLWPRLLQSHREFKRCDFVFCIKEHTEGVVKEQWIMRVVC